MTVKEAKEILEKEGCFMIAKLYGTIDYVKFQPWEKAEVKEAIAFLGKNGYRVQMDVYAAGERNTRLIEEYNMRKNDTRKDYEKINQIVDELIEGEGEPIKGEHLDPALHDSAKDFNDSLLDEQAKRIKELEATIENREEEIDILNDTMARRIKDIQDLKQTVKSDNAIIDKYEKKVKEMGKTIAHLNEVIGKKNAQLKDYKIACEEHDEQLKEYMESDKKKDNMISGLKMVNEGLRHKLADITISKVNEQALKSAESALVYKDKVIDKLKKKLEATEKARKEYCDYGIGANHFIKKICSAYVNAHERGVYSLEALFAGRKYRYNGITPKDAFKYAKEEKACNKKKIFTGVDLGSDEVDKEAKIITSKYASFDHEGFMRFVDDLKDFIENGREE